MKKQGSKRAQNRRKGPARSKARPKTSVSPRREHCGFCDKDLTDSDKALFVEEEVGRIFCTEECITQFFAPDIERLEREYFQYLPKDDLTADEKERCATLRWTTLQEPQEIWREKTLAGDYRYILISEYQPHGSKSIWSVCICLLLRGEPSFLFMAFITRKEVFVNRYRRGERVQRVLRGEEQRLDAAETSTPMVDGLAAPWTEEEIQKSERLKRRSKNDIPNEDYGLYESCVEETLEKPDEVWSWKSTNSTSTRHFHFIRRYPESKSAMWFVIVAKETNQEDQLEIIDAFPTRDSDLVNQYRRGDQETADAEEQVVVSRMVH